MAGFVSFAVRIDPVPRVVRVNLCDKAVLGRVVGNVEVLQYFLACGSGVGVDDKIALGVVASRGSHGVNEVLCVIVKSGIATGVLRGVPCVGSVEHFVIAFKKQAMVIVGKGVGYLSP